MKALLALEEAAQECRYGKVPQTYALRFALAYLWSLRRGDRGPYMNFWVALNSEGQLYRFENADKSLLGICSHLGVPRDQEAARRFRNASHDRHRRDDDTIDRVDRSSVYD